MRKEKNIEFTRPAELVQELRSRGLSDREIARKSGLHTSSICRIRTGATASPSLSAYARIYNVYMDYARN